MAVRLPAGRYAAGPGVDDALRAAAELVGSGRLVALEHRPAGALEDGLRELIGRVHAAGLAPSCDLTLPVDRLGARAVRGLAAEAATSGLGVVLAGRAGAVDSLSAWLTDATVVVPAGEPGAEFRCRQLTGGRVRLRSGGGARADLAFVRCLNVLMAGAGHVGTATADPRLIAISGERAAWNDRTPDSWEHVMPYGVRTDEQQRLVAAGQRLRVGLPSGPGAGRAALLALARRMAGRA